MNSARTRIKFRTFKGSKGYHKSHESQAIDVSMFGSSEVDTKWPRSLHPSPSRQTTAFNKTKQNISIIASPKYHKAQICYSHTSNVNPGIQ